MSRAGWFVAGFLAALGVLGVAGIVVIRQSSGFSTRQQPAAWERQLALTARRLALPARAKDARNPVPDTPAVLAEAKEHWADHCASCHANDGSGETTLGKGLYPPAPDMRAADTQQKTDGELFYVIQNGIRLTGMPGWAAPGDSGEDSWKLVRFIRRLPKLTSEEVEEMAQWNPRSSQEKLEEEQERKFLRGETDDAPMPTHAH